MRSADYIVCMKHANTMRYLLQIITQTNGLYIAQFSKKVTHNPSANRLDFLTGVVKYDLGLY